MVADRRYNDQNMYDLSTDMNIQIVCPVHRYKIYTPPPERLQLVDFYESPLRQAIYSRRSISIEPSLIVHIKSPFRINSLPKRGYDKVSAIILISILLCQILVIVYHDCKLQKDNPRAIK